MAGGIQFGSDGRLAYGMIDADRLRFVIDGAAGQPVADAQSPTFSPDAKHFAFAAQLEGGMRIVVDDRAGPSYELVGPPVFSPDSQRIAYQARRGPGRLTAVIDGVEGPEARDFWGNVVFSPDSRRTAYLPIQAGSGLIGRFRTHGQAVVDGVATGEVWDSWQSEVHFSPDSRHVAFAAVRSKVQHMILDDVASPPFDLVGPPRFGATGRLAYLTKAGAGFALFFDGARGPTIDEAAPVTPDELFLISPDGAHVASIAKVGGGWRPIIDDRIGPAYPGIGRILFEANRVTFCGFRSDGVYDVSTTLDP